VSRRFRWVSFVDAGRGLAALLGEPNAKVQLSAALGVVALALWLGLDPRDWAGLVLAGEAFNTAVEALCDRVAPERHPLVAKAKDVAAGGVLIASVVAAVLGLLVLGPPLWARLF
jgi:diacylglycerol kinase (ATP)